MEGADGLRVLIAGIGEGHDVVAHHGHINDLIHQTGLGAEQAGLVDEVVDLPMMRNYIVAFTDSCYQNPESICPFHQMLLPRTIKDYDEGHR